MKNLGIRTIWGPNVFHHRPVLLMDLDLQNLTEIASSDIPGFNERLATLFPGLHEHHCSPGRPGGFFERLATGTYFAHITEHIALELSKLCGIGVTYGKSVYDGTPGRYKVAVRFRSDCGMKYLLEQSVRIANELAHDGTVELSPILAEAKQIIRNGEMGPSTKAILAAADKRGIPWMRVNDANLIQLGYGRERKFIQATTSSLTGDIAVDIAQDKDLTKKLLWQASLPVPSGEVVYSEEQAVAAVAGFGGAAVIKPLDGNHGNGVTLGVRTAECARRAFASAIRFSKAVLVEEQFEGADYRVIVVNGKLVAAARRVPASVIGNGVHTIAELVEQENRNPLRGEGHENALTKISLDAETELFLARRGLDLRHVPPAGREIYLREAANLSQGGKAIDVTDEVHPSIRLACERAARIVGLDICGIDLVLSDIRQPFAAQHGGIIEVNAGPGIRMHHFPSAGQARDVGGAIVDMMFPNQSRGRIPIVSVTGTNGKTTVTRITGHILAEAGARVGITTSDGIYIGQECIAEGDTTGPVSALAVLSDPGVELAVLETARGGIVRRGLGYDWSDVGVITNIQPDHIGQDGIETLEDILRIKTLVAERVRPGGTLVLNADDPRLVAVAEREGRDKDIVFFSLTGNNPVVGNHCAGGGTAYFYRHGRLVEVKAGRETTLCYAHEIPLTLGGTARFQIANALAALAAAGALGYSAFHCLAGIQSFRPNHNNSGRVNTYRVGQGYVVIDYGHNPDAFRAIGDMLAHWNAPRVTGVIAVPGDRSDEILRMGAKAAARAFDRIVIREDNDLRGRAPGAGARILCQAVQEEAPEVECLQELDATRALELALRDQLPGEAVVYFYEDLAETEALLAKLGAQPLDDFTLIGIRVENSALVRAS